MVGKIFFSFHFKEDHWRAATVRSLDGIVGNQLASDDAWEVIRKGGHESVRQWIYPQIKACVCTVVLIGSNTASRRLIQYEIVKSWEAGLGVVGIHVNGLHDWAGLTSRKGENPFAQIGHRGTGKGLSSIVKCYVPGGNTSKERLGWIEAHISEIVEEGIQLRKDHM
jgi:hypothetical protein